jgi:hypothetical protein
VQQKFPTIDFVRQAYKQLFAFPKGILVTIAVFIGMSMIVASVMLASGVASENPAGKPFQIILGAVFAFGVALIAIGWIFNYWVRYGANGRDAVLPNGLAASIWPAAITGLKLLFIGILLGIVGAVVFLFTGALGWAPPFEDLQKLIADETAALDVIAVFGFAYLVVFAVMCGIYSFFSSNLTETALGNPGKEVGEPHVFEFAVVLFLIYVVLYAPIILFQVMTPLISAVTDILGSVVITTVIPLAHGLRYDWQRKTYGGYMADDEPTDSV